MEVGFDERELVVFNVDGCDWAMHIWVANNRMAFICFWDYKDG